MEARFVGMHAHVAWFGEVELGLGFPSLSFTLRLPLEDDPQVQMGKPGRNGDWKWVFGFSSANYYLTAVTWATEFLKGQGLCDQTSRGVAGRPGWPFLSTHFISNPSLYSQSLLPDTHSFRPLDSC